MIPQASHRAHNLSLQNLLIQVLTVNLPVCIMFLVWDLIGMLLSAWDHTDTLLRRKNTISKNPDILGTPRQSSLMSMMVLQMHVHTISLLKRVLPTLSTVESCGNDSASHSHTVLQIRHIISINKRYQWPRKNGPWKSSRPSSLTFASW